MTQTEVSAVLAGIPASRRLGSPQYPHKTGTRVRPAGAPQSTKTWHCFPSLSECLVVSTDPEDSSDSGTGLASPELQRSRSEVWSRWGACWDTGSAGRAHPLHSRNSVCTWLILPCQSVRLFLCVLMSASLLFFLDTDKWV